MVRNSGSYATPAPSQSKVQCSSQSVCVVAMVWPYIVGVAIQHPSSPGLYPEQEEKLKCSSSLELLSCKSVVTRRKVGSLDGLALKPCLHGTTYPHLITIHVNARFGLDSDHLFNVDRDLDPDPDWIV